MYRCAGCGLPKDTGWREEVAAKFPLAVHEFRCSGPDLPLPAGRGAWGWGTQGNLMFLEAQETVTHSQGGRVELLSGLGICSKCNNCNKLGKDIRMQDCIRRETLEFKRKKRREEHRKQFSKNPRERRVGKDDLNPPENMYYFCFNVHDIKTNYVKQLV